MTELQTAIDSNYLAVIAVAGLSVNYRRGTVPAVVLTAVPGKSSHKVDTEYGIIAKETRDFIFRAADLGVLFPPKISDRIEQTVGDEVHIFEVIAPNGSNDHFETPDPAKSIIRVHTQLVDTA